MNPSWTGRCWPTRDEDKPAKAWDTRVVARRDLTHSMSESDWRQATLSGRLLGYGAKTDSGVFELNRFTIDPMPCMDWVWMTMMVGLAGGGTETEANCRVRALL